MSRRRGVSARRRKFLASLAGVLLVLALADGVYVTAGAAAVLWACVVVAVLLLVDAMRPKRRRRRGRR